MARKGRARRFREARKLKEGFDDGLFEEGTGSLADAEEDDSDHDDDHDEWSDVDEDDDGYDWDPDRHVDGG